MMVFKNKGKDQEVSESPFPASGKVTESLARRKFSAAESRRSHVRRPARCHLFPLGRVRACVYTCELLRFPPDFSLSSLFLPHLLSLFIFFPSILSFFSRSIFLPTFYLCFLFFPSLLPFFPLKLPSLVSSLVLLVACFYNLLGY